jgi:CelD/BcsL family acetyltransferase involved in cellulose biosynthesis
VQAAPYITIDGDWDAYEGGLRRKFRSELRRRRRRLEEEGRLTLEISDGTERLVELLEEGFSVEGAGWKGDYGTSIASRPETRRFYSDVARWAAGRGWLRLAFLRLDGRALAFDYCLEYDDTHYLLKTGYDPAYRKFAPGMIIRHRMLERAFHEGITTYDFLGMGSDFAWKREWADAQQERLFMHMFAPTAPGVLDRAVFVLDRSAMAQAKRLARSSVIGERGRRLLKRAHATITSRLGR